MLRNCVYRSGLKVLVELIELVLLRGLQFLLVVVVLLDHPRLGDWVTFLPRSIAFSFTLLRRCIFSVAARFLHSSASALAVGGGF